MLVMYYGNTVFPPWRGLPLQQAYYDYCSYTYLKDQVLLSCTQDYSVLSGLLHVMGGTLVQVSTWFCCSSKQAREKAEILEVQGNANTLYIKPIYISDTSGT